MTKTLGDASGRPALLLTNTFSLYREVVTSAFHLFRYKHTLHSAVTCFVLDCFTMLLYFSCNTRAARFRMLFVPLSRLPGFKGFVYLTSAVSSTTSLAIRFCFRSQLREIENEIKVIIIIFIPSTIARFYLAFVRSQSSVKQAYEKPKINRKFIYIYI